MEAAESHTARVHLALVVLSESSRSPWYGSIHGEAGCRRP